MKHHIAFATCAKLGGLTSDDRLAADFLRQQNFSVDAAPWDDPEIDWRRYDAVILRSTWDYHYKLPAFLQWISQLEERGLRLWNPPHAVRANVSKRYLIDLQQEGISIVPTIWIPRGSQTQLEDILKHNGWNQAIIKPDVSASAYRTTMADLLTMDQSQMKLSEILNDSGALVQEFRKEVITSGEWSLIFFQKNFSHAVIKSPPFNDFRVQEELGGIVQSAVPSEALIKEATKVLNHVTGPLLYARVDGIWTEQQFLLMELELIEPSLFLEFETGAAERFADNILQIL